MTVAPSRRWYLKPDMLVGYGALIASLCAVVVSVYSAALQRTHDKAEVWPHLEVSLWTTPKGSTLSLENTGIGPAVVEYVRVDVDGQQAADWPDVLKRTLGAAPKTFDQSTVVDRALRAGDRVVLVGLPLNEMDSTTLDRFKHIALQICYRSVYGDRWHLTDAHIGGQTQWHEATTCPSGAGSEF